MNQPLRMVIIGPTHPYKGGIALETTELAHRLKASGHDVFLLSWKTMYPHFLYPGKQFVPNDRPEDGVFLNSQRILTWYNPFGWIKNILAFKNYDRIIFVWWVPTIQGPVYLTMLRALGKKRPLCILLCHNVLPHETRLGDKRLTQTLLRRVDLIITHTVRQSQIAAKFTTKPIKTVRLPPVLPSSDSSSPKIRNFKLNHHLLFFGIVRPYKGLDILLKALVPLTNIHLTVAGEFWNYQFYSQLIEQLQLTDRVKLLDGYVPSNKIEQLFKKVDALVLPYKSVTGSYLASLGHNYGLPIIGTLSDQINHDRDGLLCSPGNVEQLTSTIEYFYQPGVAQRLKTGVPRPTVDQEWKEYLLALNDF